MNRRQKIIISVTGIFIVLLVLLGLTYAYFLTRITGNTNPNSISVTTANLELVYGDGTTSILTSATPIEPGKFSSSKDFTVTNNGNALTDYAVTLEDFSITYAADTVIDGVTVKAGTVTKMEYPDDMKMTITCVIESDNEDRNGQACGNINGTLPTENSILLTNSIEVDDVHKYVLTLTYVESGADQSADMNKTIQGKIDIIDPKSTIDLEGSVATYQTGDYVEINSTPIKSEIVDGSYKLIGVEPGDHTLYVKYKDANGDVQTRGSETLTIKKGDIASVSGNDITFTDASRIATVDINSDYTISVDEEIKETEKKDVPMLAPGGSFIPDYFVYEGEDYYSDLEILEITFVDVASEEIISSADYSWPAAVDSNNDGINESDIMGYWDYDTGIVTIAGNGSGSILANYDSSGAFLHQLLSEINNLTLLDTSRVTNMSSMFYECRDTDLNLSNFDTRNVTNMDNMFGWSKVSVDISSFDTKNVTNMEEMFVGFEGGTIYVSEKFVTTNVKNSEEIFRECYDLTGGNGTAWSEEHIGIEYARIDAPGTPGYFTAK